MKRPIKFRGKWIYGDNNWVSGGIVSDDEHASIATYDAMYEVIPSTLGQYTGLKDISGTEIYEGDIVKISVRPTLVTAETNKRNAELVGIQMPSWLDGGDIIARVSFFDTAFHFVTLKSYLPGNHQQEPMVNYLFEERHPDCEPTYKTTMEVIGNIHDKTTEPNKTEEI